MVKQVLDSKFLPGILITCAIAVPVGLAVYGVCHLADKAADKLAENFLDAVIDAVTEEGVPCNI